MERANSERAYDTANPYETIELFGLTEKQAQLPIPEAAVLTNRIIRESVEALLWPLGGTVSRRKSNRWPMGSRRSCGAARWRSAMKSTAPPTRSASWQNSTMDQRSLRPRWFGPCGMDMGAMVPIARLRSPRLRTVNQNHIQEDLGKVLLETTELDRPNVISD